LQGSKTEVLTVNKGDIGRRKQVGVSVSPTLVMPLVKASCKLLAFLGEDD
jgi:hypothetical protein